MKIKPPSDVRKQLCARSLNPGDLFRINIPSTESGVFIRMSDSVVESFKPASVFKDARTAGKVIVLDTSTGKITWMGPDTWVVRLSVTLHDEP